tara:strand:+ start:3474 stop:4049 length:576 start_codon:yes stop_codon:yes gene_type:complete
MSKDKEVRQYNAPEIRTEQDDDGNTIVTGYAAVFGQQSEDLGGFTEIIHRDAFNDVLENDVVYLFNHDNNIVFGRSTSGTLKLSVDDHGLKTSVTMPNTSAANDAIELMKRGDINKMSFGFYIEADKWIESDSGLVREVLQVKKLVDVSLVTRPAYPQTSAALRSLDAYNSNTILRIQRRKNKLRILKLKK